MIKCLQSVQSTNETPTLKINCDIMQSFLVMAIFPTLYMQKKTYVVLNQDVALLKFPPTDSEDSERNCSYTHPHMNIQDKKTHIILTNQMNYVHFPGAR